MPQVTDDTPARREEISRRLKAARMLAGSGLRVRKGSKKGKGEVAELSIETLAQHPVAMENGLTPNRLREIEQMRTYARPWELQALSEALKIDLELLPVPANRSAIERELAEADLQDGRREPGSDEDDPPRRAAAAE